MQCLKAVVPSLVALLLVGCASDKSFFNLQTPSASQADQYVETDGLGKLPSKKIAMISFGIEFDTNVVYAKQKSGLYYTGTISKQDRSHQSLERDNAVNCRRCVREARN